jgi:hypothetical protein
VFFQPSLVVEPIVTAVIQKAIAKITKITFIMIIFKGYLQIIQSNTQISQWK